MKLVNSQLPSPLRSKCQQEEGDSHTFQSSYKVSTDSFCPHRTETAGLPSMRGKTL